MLNIVPRCTLLWCKTTLFLQMVLDILGCLCMPPLPNEFFLFDCPRNLELIVMVPPKGCKRHRSRWVHTKWYNTAQFKNDLLTNDIDIHSWVEQFPWCYTLILPVLYSVVRWHFFLSTYATDAWALSLLDCCASWTRPEMTPILHDAPKTKNDFHIDDIDAYPQMEQYLWSVRMFFTLLYSGAISFASDIVVNCILIWGGWPFSSKLSEISWAIDVHSNGWLCTVSWRWLFMLKTAMSWHQMVWYSTSQ